MDLTIKNEIDSMEESCMRREIVQENFCTIFFYVRLAAYVTKG